MRVFELGSIQSGLRLGNMKHRNCCVLCFNVCVFEDLFYFRLDIALSSGEPKTMPLKTHLSLLTSLILLTLPTLSLALNQTCKTTPTDPTWPSPSDWDNLNQTLSGSLLSPIPPGAVCHSTHPTYNTTLCTEVQNSWSSEYFHQADPISVEWNNWNNDSCLPIEGFPCSAVGYPVMVINATETEDVRLGVEFGEFC